ncbi:MAG: amidase family protein [Pseudomonadota bacterium]
MTVLDCQSTATQIAAAMRSGDTTEAAYRALIQPAIERANSCNAYARMETHNSGASGPLAGVPVSVKDNIALADSAVTAATPAFAELQLEENSAISRLRAAGAGFIGKTNLHELAFGITGNNTFTGPGLNPFDTHYLAGGSSAGAAITVATGAAAIGIGTDTGGSCRIPAAHCGVFGFRPTTGRYPSGGIVELSSSRDTLGILARSVADIQLADSVMLERQPQPGVNRISKPVIGVVAPDSFGVPVYSGVAEAFKAAIATLTDAGYRCLNVDLSAAIAADAACGFPIVSYETHKSLSELVRSKLQMPFDEFVSTVKSPDVAALLASQLGPEAVTDEMYETAITKELPHLRACFDEAFEQNAVDVLLYPTSLFPPPPVGVADSFEYQGVELPTFVAYTATTRPDSMAGQPAISLPCGLVEGLPVGLQLVAPRQADDALLAIAATCEALLDPRPRPSF